MTQRDHNDESLFTFDGQRGLHRNQDNPLTPRLTSPFFSRSMSTVLIPSAMFKRIDCFYLFLCGQTVLFSNIGSEEVYRYLWPADGGG